MLEFEISNSLLNLIKLCR